LTGTGRCKAEGKILTSSHDKTTVQRFEKSKPRIRLFPTERAKKEAKKPGETGRAGKKRSWNVLAQEEITRKTKPP